jgi:hypothetical protein
MKFLIGLILIAFLVSSGIPHFVEANHFETPGMSIKSYCNSMNKEVTSQGIVLNQEKYQACIENNERHNAWSDAKAWIAGIIILIIIVGIIIAIAKAKSLPSPTYSDNTDYSYTAPVVRRGWTVDEKEQVRIRQDGKCAHCGKPPPRWDYHHVDGDRSNNGLSNCEGLCPNCHSVETHEG